MIKISSKTKKQDKNSANYPKKKIHFENSTLPLFSNFKKITFPQFANMIYNSESKQKALYEAKEFALKILEFEKQYQKKEQQVKLKFVLKKLKRPECQRALMNILGITNTASFNIYADGLIEQGMIKKVGLDDLHTKKVAEIYNLTKSIVRTSHYYVNNSNNDFQEDHYSFIIDDSLTAAVNSKVEGFEFLKKEARQERNKPKTKLAKCIQAIENWKFSQVKMVQLMQYLSYELEIAPKSDKLFQEYLKLLVQKGILVKTVDKFRNEVFEKNVR